MKGLMVSLIIVIFAGTTSSVLAAGQQDAAGVEPRSGLQPMVAPTLERPGPDDSDDNVAWPVPKSLLSGESTNTSSFGDQQFRGPAPDSASDNNIRFDVKVDENAIALLKQGRKVFSPVEVLDRDTKTPMNPSVVSDIALFMGANAGKDLKGVALEPQPMERGSSTLRFEIPEQDLDRIQEDAFLFSVPDELRGKFNRVEFVAVSGPTGSHEFSSVLSSGTRGSALGFENQGGTNRFASPTTSRFDGANETQPWNTNAPQPGPGFSPGEREFTGPSIDKSVLDERRNRVAPLDTGNQFQLGQRKPAVQSTQSPFGRSWEQPEATQNTRGRNTFDQNQNVGRQSTYNEPATDQQGYQESLAETRLRLVQQQLAAAEAEKKKLQQNAGDWMREAEKLAQQRNNLNQQLQATNDRPSFSQPGNTRPVDYSQQYGTDYLGKTIDAAKGIVRPFGSQREDFRTQETGYSGRTSTELEQQKLIEAQRRQIEYQNEEKFRLEQDKLMAENRLASAEGVLKRRPTYDNEIQFQQASYNGNNSNENPNRDNVRVAEARTPGGPPNRRPGALAGDPTRTKNVDQTDNGTDGLATGKRSESSDLFWLLPLLIGSLALNFFLWVHARSLYMRYDELAEELRGMVSASTI